MSCRCTVPRCQQNYPSRRMPEARPPVGSGISKERFNELRDVVDKAAQGKVKLTLWTTTESALDNMTHVLVLSVDIKGAFDHAWTIFSCLHEHECPRNIYKIHKDCLNILGKKTFTVFGKYLAVRDALKARGWIQNFDLQKLSGARQRQTHDDVSVAARMEGRGDDERQVISRLLRHVPVSFIWATSEPIDWNNLTKTTIVSRFPRVFFTTKIGIASYLGESHWFHSPGIAAMFPRCHILSNPEDLELFSADFRLTACLALLTTLVSGIEAQTPNLFVTSGKVPLKVVEFAVKRISEYVSSRQHDDIDKEDGEKIWDHQWDQFLTHYYQTAHSAQPYQIATDQQIQEMYNCAKLSLESVAPFWPQMGMDGTHNLWIVKPGAKSRGRGIQVINRLEQLQSRIGVFNGNEPRLVVQKYIERPLLIYNTKFDIRQWFLVTSIYPLTIWMYKECYLRFCSHIFSLSNMHESVHLSNNAIQCKYKNEKKRNKLLPDENMWDSQTFQAYLRTIGEQEKWENVIYPGMRGAFACALLSAQDHVSPRPNTFELYGVDFMLTEDLQPWLIEINSSPCMSPTTSVTARLCPQCLEDIIKVVIDRRGNKEAETGMFELAYKQEISNPPPYTGMNLTVRGTRLRTGTRAARPDEIRTGPDQTMKEAIRRLSEQLRDESSATSGVCSAESRHEPVERKRKVKRHCCSGRTSISQAVQRYRHSKSRPESVSRRINSCHELYDWRKRVERTKLDCKTTLMNFGEERAKSPQRVGASRLPEIPRKSSRDLNNNLLEAAKIVQRPPVQRTINVA